jgi:ribonuclease HI
MILPKMLWASPAWWTGTDTICDPLKSVYHKIARWITGIRNPTAPISKLLAAAQLPPMHLYLDYLSARYAVRLHFLEEGHVLTNLVTPPPQANRSRAHTNLPSINRLLTYTDPMIDGPLEDRRTEAEGRPVIQSAGPVHRDKDKKAREIHQMWVETLPKGTIVVYTDGSKLANGSTGSGWGIYRTVEGREELVTAGCCHLGEKAEVVDAELHAVHEGLLALKEMEVSTSKTYVCIDNTSAILSLGNNHQNAQYARQSLATAEELSGKGWELLTVWTPSHCDIVGNEKADEMAKRGAEGEEVLGECFYACITKNWLLAETKRTLYRKWKLEIPQATCRLSSPTHYNSLSYQQTAAVLRIYAGRTETDGLRNDLPTPCKCEMANLSSAHILTECRLMDQARLPLTKKFPEGEIMTTEIAIHPKYVLLVSEFARKTGLGYTKELRYDRTAHNQLSSEPSDSESEWDSELGNQFGAFE